MIDRDGGPAFPCEKNHEALDERVPHLGMTLRDYFAAKALANLYTHDSGNPGKVAEWAYHIADAMLAERESAR
jgi:hypothetical protein